ncbi:mCG147962 [Mus musculus]|nr:mCG147962 [Mus musculus]
MTVCYYIYKMSHLVSSVIFQEENVSRSHLSQSCRVSSTGIRGNRCTIKLGADENSHPSSRNGDPHLHFINLPQICQSQELTVCHINGPKPGCVSAVCSKGIESIYLATTLGAGRQL